MKYHIEPNDFFHPMKRVIEIFCNPFPVWVDCPEEADIVYHSDKLCVKGKGCFYIATSMLDVASCKKIFFRLLSSVLGNVSEWGILSGGRPVRLLRQDIAAHELKTRDQAVDYLQQRYLLSEEKAHLLYDVALVEAQVAKESLDTTCLYVGIPFCPSKCRYCSFPSEPIYGKQSRIAAYLTYLQFEISARANPETDVVYVGGGTPAILTSVQIESLFHTIWNVIDRRQVKEVTFEAGRIDCLSFEQLKKLKSCGVTRVCLNPQSLNARSLKAVNRTLDVDRMWALANEAKSMGMSVNMDMILGLPEETVDSFNEGLKEILLHEPDQVTLHALAIKAKSGWREEENFTGGQVNKMSHVAYSLLAKAGYEPYYLYRIKQMAGNLENIGFSRSDSVGIYNVRMIGEINEIVACGAGASSKLNHSKSHIVNPLGIEAYMERIKEKYM